MSRREQLFLDERASLRTAIRFGVPGTSMHGFADVLSDADLAHVIDVLKAFAPKTFAKPGAPIAIGPPHARDAARGVQLWMQHGCDKCHDANGRGDVPGLQVRPYDLTTQLLRRPRLAPPSPVMIAALRALDALPSAPQRVREVLERARRARAPEIRAAVSA